MDNSKLLSRLGKICNWIASSGNSGIGAFPTCLDLMICPSGIFTLTGLMAGCRLFKGVLIKKNGLWY